MGFFNSFWNRRTAINTGKSARTLKKIERNQRKANEDPRVTRARENTKSARALAKQYKRDGSLK